MPQYEQCAPVTVEVIPLRRMLFCRLMHALPSRGMIQAVTSRAEPKSVLCSAGGKEIGGGSTMYVIAMYELELRRTTFTMWQRAMHIFIYLWRV